MFKSKNDSTPLKLENEKFDTLIGRETLIKGDMTLRESIRVDGAVHGHLSADADKQVSVVIGQTGLVQGNVMAHRILVAGHVQGNIHALDRLELREGCSVRGDVKYATLAIEHGAEVQGTLNKVVDGQ